MCGRFALGLPHDEIQQLHGYNVQVGEWVGQDQFVPRYNVAPRSQAPIIRRRDQGEGSSSESSSTQPGPSSRTSEPGTGGAEVESIPDEGSGHPNPAGVSHPSQEHGLEDAPLPVIMQTMRWGLVPHFSKHEDPSLKTINARCEALIEEPRGMWASIKGKKRCAVICQGYYEWLKKGKERLPHFTKRADGRLMLLAGLWDRVVLEGSTEPLWTFTIVTTDASKEFSWLHDRQPVILSDDVALRAWLDTSSGKWTPELSKLCAPYHASDHPLVCYAVPKEVGKIGTDSPTFVEPIAERKDGIQAMFAKQTLKDTRTSAKSSPRKRSASPTNDKTDVKGEAQSAKKAKIEKVNAWEDDSDIEYVDDQDQGNHADERKRKDSKITSTLTRAGQNPSKDTPVKSSQKVEEKPSKLSPRKAKHTEPPSTSSAKITSFFSKK
ncbi:DUF159-domain-containing protein [Polyporus arcularius HHB13444]|uniref:DUF159-domain-containing protein n=1 Tax=Polyporus arcularius HHB13444 TaxID=1314778 RepID=A0A5C3NVG8_9APHY|nr:DUF159-domain-containing protein [Polyporus arcularius HHB13444]